MWNMANFFLPRFSAKTAVKMVFLSTIKSMAGSAASELIIYVRLVTF